MPFGEPESIEKQLACNENQAAQVLSKIRRQKSVNISISDKQVWARFVFLQLARDPRALRKSLMVASDLHQAVLKKWQHMSADELLTIESVRNQVRASIFGHNGESQEWVASLLQWNWQLLVGPPMFVTSDMPVLLTLSGMMPDQVVCTIMMALSPELLLVLTPAAWAGECDNGWYKDAAVTFNMRLASLRPHFVYSCRPLDTVPMMSARALEELLEPFPPVELR